MIRPLVMGSAKISPIAVDNVARAALNECLARSIVKVAEYGGMIYLQGGAPIAKPAVTQGDPNHVDVGVHEPNRGCPSGTTPIAYYHTHPVYERGGFHFEYNNFDQEDKDVVLDNDLDAGYMGSLDGSFFKFDRKQNRVFPLPGRLKNTE